MIRASGLLLFGLLVAFGLVGCSPAPPVAVCATQDRPPIVMPDEACPGPGVQVYSAPASDIDGDDWPEVGQPLDGDFWNLADQLDLDEAHRQHRSGSYHGTKTYRPSATPAPGLRTTGAPVPTAKTTVAPRPSTKASAKTRSTR